MANSEVQKKALLFSIPLILYAAAFIMHQTALSTVQDPYDRRIISCAPFRSLASSTENRKITPNKYNSIGPVLQQSVPGKFKTTHENGAVVQRADHPARHQPGHNPLTHGKPGQDDRNTCSHQSSGCLAAEGGGNKRRPMKVCNI